MAGYSRDDCCQNLAEIEQRYGELAMSCAGGRFQYTRGIQYRTLDRMAPWFAFSRFDISPTYKNPRTPLFIPLVSPPLVVSLSQGKLPRYHELECTILTTFHFYSVVELLNHGHGRRTYAAWLTRNYHWGYQYYCHCCIGA